MKAFNIFLLYFYISFNALITCSTSADTITINQTIKDGQTIVSAQETFELGFFSPSNTSENRYLGIWYKLFATGTVVWVANRETPLTNKTGELTLQLDGVLVLRDSLTSRIIWSSSSLGTNQDPIARLLDSGNLMVIDSEKGPENYIWQSFDHPGDTYLPGMKFGRNLERGIVTNFTSWKKTDDPSQGQYMVYTNFSGLPQIFQKDGDEIQYRLGLWSTFGQSGSPLYTSNTIYTINQVTNERETYSEFELVNGSVFSLMRLTPTGNMGQFIWNTRTKQWFLVSTPTSDNCARYALCGGYGRCESELPYCSCLEGFVPKKLDQWKIADQRSGCERKIALDCSFGEGFQKFSSIKLPDTSKSWFDSNMTLEQCKVKCKNECNCTAYTALDIKAVTGCLLWYDELNDMRTFTNSGQEIYIRMAAGALDTEVSKKKKNVSIIVIPVVVGFFVLLSLCLFIFLKRKSKAPAQGKGAPITQNGLDVPLFSLSTLQGATNNFSENNKLGEGGFGPVYKGFLDGREVAVKRLSKSSRQGVEELNNEVIFISKLQHRNLVKVLGCCIEGQEKMLVYEYMSNKGLDLFIFEETRSKLLDWPRRLHIINGIARGLLYLHQDSRLRVVHRDLKAANILLDHNMNPKISDFGLARSFGGNETSSNTNRVVGTYGYISPEYAANGIFSVKSDVFSFGVIVLEIVSGKRNRGFYDEATYHNLLGHAWTLYKEGKNLELADPSLDKSGHTYEMLRSIHVGLLCVQCNPEDRPNMSAVVTMLSGDGELPDSKQPGFYIEEDGKLGQTQISSGMNTQSSNNDVTITLLDPRYVGDFSVIKITKTKRILS